QVDFHCQAAVEFRFVDSRMRLGICGNANGVDACLLQQPASQDILGTRERPIVYFNVAADQEDLVDRSLAHGCFQELLQLCSTAQSPCCQVRNRLEAALFQCLQRCQVFL